MQGRPDSPWENLSVGVGPTCWTSLPLAFPSRSWATFPMCGTVPYKYASNFVLSSNIPPWKLFRWFRSLRLWTTGDWQLHHNNTPAHASHLVPIFWVKHQITQVTQPHYSPDFVPHDFWLFPKLKSPLKGNRFQIVDEIQENMMRQLMAIGRTVWDSNVPSLKGTEASLSYVQCFLYNLQ